jgi:hypothetical protein
MAWPGRAGLGKARVARLMKGDTDVSHQRRMRQGRAGLGEARRGKAGLGKARVARPLEG